MFNLTAAPVNYEMSEGRCHLAEPIASDWNDLPAHETIGDTDASVPEWAGGNTVDLHAERLGRRISLPVTMTVESGCVCNAASLGPIGRPRTQVVYDLTLTNSGTTEQL
jgi:hypothetical protein